MAVVWSFSGTSFVCPILVGRTRERELVDRCLIGPGPPGLLLSGEAGIGKSRLARELAATANGRGFQVLWGQCIESDRSVPYGPLLDVLDSLFSDRSPEELLHPLGSLAQDVVKVVPQYSSSAANFPAPATMEPGLEKRRLFQALAALFLRLADSRPVLLVIEDVHWSDDATLEFLLYLKRRAARQRLLTLVTYRTEEVNAGLDAFLSATDRERLAQELTLKPLTVDEVDEMLQAILGCPSPPMPREFVDAIHALTEGNPFFIEEMLKSLATSEGHSLTRERLTGKAIDGVHVPRSIAHAVQRRLERLSPGSRRLATVAAVAGRRFDLDVLKAVTQQDEAALLVLVKELVAAQLVVEEAADAFTFRHALTRQAIYAQLLGREREAYHLEVLDALERLGGAADGPRLSDLAYHAWQAGTWIKALDYAYRAGQRARSLYAPRVAIEHFTRALQAAQALAVRPPPGLYRERGQVYEVLGEFHNARADLETSLGMACEEADSRSEWEALVDLGMLWAGQEYAQAGQYYRQALDLAARTGERALLARSLNRLGNWHLNVSHPQQALRYHQRALETFRRLDDQQSAAETLDLLGMTSYLGGDMATGWRYYGEAVDRFTALDDRRGLVSSLSTRYGLNNAYHGSTVAVVRVQPEESVRECQRALDIARSIGWRSGEAYAMVNLALVLGTQGRYGQAFQLLSRSYQIAEEIEHRQWMCRASTILGTLYLDVMAYPQAIACLEQALDLAKVFGAVFWLHTAAGRLASAYIQQARLDAAASVLRDYHAGDRDDDHTVGTRILLRSRAELALAQHDVDRALEVAEQLMASAARGEDSTPYGLLMLRGEAHALARRYQQAEADLQAARDSAARRNFTAALWRVHAHLARVYRALGRRADARREIAAAHAIIDQAAAELPDQQLRETFLREARRKLPPLSARTAHRRERAPGGLTDREQDVARLVAQGMTNRQIAQMLVIEERTVESHVSNIMSKLGVNARARIISWAFEQGLVDGSR